MASKGFKLPYIGLLVRDIHAGKVSAINHVPMALLPRNGSTVAEKLDELDEEQRLNFVLKNVLNSLYKMELNKEDEGYRPLFMNKIVEFLKSRDVDYDPRTKEPPKMMSLAEYKKLLGQ